MDRGNLLPLSSIHWLICLCVLLAYLLRFVRLTSCIHSAPRIALWLRVLTVLLVALCLLLVGGSRGTNLLGAAVFGQDPSNNTIITTIPTGTPDLRSSAQLPPIGDSAFVRRVREIRVLRQVVKEQTEQLSLRTEGGSIDGDSQTQIQQRQNTHTHRLSVPSFCVCLSVCLSVCFSPWWCVASFLFSVGLSQGRATGD